MTEQEWIGERVTHDGTDYLMQTRGDEWSLSRFGDEGGLVDIAAGTGKPPAPSEFASLPWQVWDDTNKRWLTP